MRPLSATARQAIFAPETDRVFLCLLTITNVGLANPLYFVNDTQNIISRGHTYIGCPFQIALPDDLSEQLPKVSLAIDNVSQQMTAAIRSLITPPTVTLEVVVASSPETLEAGPFNFTLRNCIYDAQLITGELMYEDVLNEPFPCDTITPGWFPGLFQES